ncbi:MAG: 30S ribosomal protein S20 [Acidobacteria bacterium]|nr:30S ribosomal protein S20 [Acidobacteriota bacterium]
MANHKSAQKKAKQDIARRASNRSGRSTLRSALKKYRASLADGSQPSQSLQDIQSLIDRSAKRGLIHTNAANRLKSRLTKQTSA